MTLGPALPGLNVGKILDRLEGFQRAAVEHAFKRLYETPDTTRRFLIADEVGLGKTLIAKGIIAKAIEHLDRQGVERIDVVYICSNQQIARQNIRRLSLTGEDRMTHAKRVTLLPLSIHELAANRVNFVAFTPSTSLDLKSSLGVGEERRLLYWLLEDLWELRGTAPKNLLQGNVRNTRWFRDRLDSLPERHEISEELKLAFHEGLERESVAAHEAGRPDLRERFHDCCRFFRRPNPSLSHDQRHERATLVSDLRTGLARTCIQALEPDIVVLDEFQRFKQLLEGTTEAGELAHQLFDYSDENSAVRVLMLSATPYKMYTLAHEADEDDHYADFHRTVRFLDPDPDRHAGFKEALEDWRRELYRLGDGGEQRLPAIKARIESHLRRVMSRTERVGVAGDRDAMLREVAPTGVHLTERDVEAFVHLARIARELERPGVLEYWKSAPFTLNVMENYLLKKDLLERIQSNDQGDLPRLLSAASDSLLDWRKVRAYEALDPPNPRLRALSSDLERADAFRLLWIPPTLPYWQLQGGHARARDEGFTKRLIFSSWTVVPKAIATLLSYEAERRIFRTLEPDPDQPPVNTARARKRRSPLLRFAKADGRLSGMPVLTLLYPSPALAELGDPLDEHPGGGSALPTAEDLLLCVEGRIQPQLNKLAQTWVNEEREDGSWYWAAPILLDLARDPEGTRDYWNHEGLEATWSGSSEDEDGADLRWSEHVYEARRLLENDLPMGRPPADLARVCALIALAGPATCALRAIARAFGDMEAIFATELRLASAQVGWEFRTYLNRPESMAILRAGAAKDEPYWHRVLTYSAEGCLTSTLDEWVHLLRDGLGLFDTPVTDAASRITEAMSDALTLRTVNHEVHQLTVAGGAAGYEPRSLRAHFALRFGSEKSEDQKQAQREEQVRQAFNSPFWPFVLASTSVGQEGLDFHPYCHAVVHWNLPSNPVDLEQREGRVHRFKGHAVRRNVALRHGPEALLTPDPWTSAFAAARATAPSDQRGLVPYWVYPLSDPSAAFIERHVPALPLSRDTARLAALRRSLAAYRLVFGQPRQDDLMAYLLGHVEEASELIGGSFLQIDLAPASVSALPQP